MVRGIMDKAGWVPGLFAGSDQSSARIGRIHGCTVVCIVGLLLTGAVGCRRVSQKELITEAAQAAADGGYDTATELIESFLKREPDSVSARVLYGLCLSYRSRHERAREELRRAADLAPDDFLTQYFFGWGLVKCGRYGEAVVPLRGAYQLREQYPDLIPDLLVLLSRCCLEQSLPEGKRYLQALRKYGTFSSDPALYNALAILFFNEREYELAKENFIKAWQLDAQGAVVLLNLAVLHEYYLGDAREAMRFYRYSLKAFQLAGDTSRQSHITARLRELAQRRLRPAGNSGVQSGRHPNFSAE